MFATNCMDRHDAPPMDDSIMELSLLMTRRQFDALVERARADGISVAQFLRRLVQVSISEPLPIH